MDMLSLEMAIPLKFIFNCFQKNFKLSAFVAYYLYSLHTNYQLVACTLLATAETLLKTTILQIFRHLFVIILTDKTENISSTFFSCQSANKKATYRNKILYV